MIDLHSHILPGIDDGARTIADSRELARRAASEGVTAIAATPHVRSDYPTTPERMERGVGDLRRDFAQEGILVEVLHGGEIALDRFGDLSAGELARFTLGQSGRYLLLEFPYFSWPFALDHRLFDVLAIGMKPVLAHPERNADVQRRPERLEDTVRGGALVQVTAASLDGRLGSSAKRTSERLLELGLVHVLASDAHTAAVREAGLTSAVEAVGDGGLARFLTEDAPAAIVAGDDLPERPPRARKRRLRLF